MSAEPAPPIHEAAVRSHAELIHNLAAPLAGQGKIVVACFSEDPGQTNPKTNKPGLQLPPTIPHFAIGDVKATVRTICSLTVRQHSNTYMPLSVFKPDLRRGTKGYEKDIVAVLGLVADFDDPDAARWAARLPVMPNYVLETSAGRFQAFYLFDKPQPPEAAKAVAERLKAFARCDSGSSDMSHVWRVAGSLNWPNGKKVHEYGRPLEPQQVRICAPWDGTLTSIEKLSDALPQAEPDSGAEQQPASEEPQAGAADVSVELLVRQLPTRLHNRIIEPTVGDRSKALFSVIKALDKRGCNAALIEQIIRAYPAGIGEKYVGRDDLDREIARVLTKASRRDAAASQMRDARGDKPVVYVIGGALVKAIEETEQHILTRDPGIYQRGDFLVRAAPVAIPIADDRQTIGLRLIRITFNHLIERFSHAIDF